MILNLSLDLPEDGHYLRIARLLSRTLMEHLKVIQRDIDDVEVIVGELCANVLRHAASQEGRYRVSIVYYDDRVEIGVEDKGYGFSMGDLAPVGSEREDFDGQRRLGGYGLKLIESLSDRIEFQATNPHGTTAKAVKSLRYETQADAEEATRIDTGLGRVSITAHRK